MTDILHLLTTEHYMKKIKKDKVDTLLSLRVPGHFHKTIKTEAEKIGITLTDYVTAILINEMRTGLVKKDIEYRILNGNILWAMYPREKDVYGGTPEDKKLEMDLQTRAYRRSHKKDK